MKEFKLPSVNNIKIGDIGFRFRKDFMGHGIFEGQVIEINNNLRRCIYSDGDIEDLNLEKLLYWNSKYLPSKKEIYYKNYKKDQVIDEIIDSISPSNFPSPFHPVLPSPEIYSNDISIQEPEEVKKNNIIEHNISLVSQNVYSLRSDKQRINLDSIIDTMMSK